MTAPVEWSPWTPPLPPHPRATTSLVLGIVALSGLVLLLPLVLGPVAWYVGARTVREVDREPERWSGRSNARAGLVLGVVATGLLALSLVVTAMVVLGVVLLNAYDSGYPL